MKKLHILGLAISAALCAPMAAQASTGTITFAGALKSSTCVVTAPGAGSFTVTLPTLATSALGALGSVAGATPFSITVSNCESGITSFTPFFEAGLYTDYTSGRLNIATGAGNATNVQLQLLNSDLSVIDVAKAYGSQNVHSTTVSGTPGSGTGTYVVRYYSLGSATAGTVSSSVTYSMVYV